VKTNSATTLFWRVLFYGFATRTKPYDFFRVSLNSINRLVTIEKDTRDFGEKFTALMEAIFQIYSFPFILFYEDN
jgi:hypothetical protein